MAEDQWKTSRAIRLTPEAGLIIGSGAVFDDFIVFDIQAGDVLVFKYQAVTGYLIEAARFSGLFGVLLINRCIICNQLASDH
ncbi:MAG: hypothetical protein JAZ19_22220 [Candidatus Thiodiazotropha taylori]|nr:hypothetical protein [Candidatus Thiodiazotropha taylori]